MVFPKRKLILKEEETIDPGTIALDIGGKDWLFFHFEIQILYSYLFSYY